MRIKMVLIALALLLLPSLVTAETVTSLYREFELLASRTETTTGTLATGVASLEKRRRGDFKLDQGHLRCYLEVTAASAGDTLDVDLIGVVNGARYLIGSFAQVGAVPATETVEFSQAPETLAVDWTIAGTTPSYTFNIQCHRR